jgi:hypothetical protein
MTRGSASDGQKWSAGTAAAAEAAAAEAAAAAAALVLFLVCASWAMTHSGIEEVVSTNQAVGAWLLQLPDAALHLLLQKLDQRSLACTAATCSVLVHPVLACTRHVPIRFSNPFEFLRFSGWLEQHRTSLINLCQCSVFWSCREPVHFHISNMPCPQLRRLHLKGLTAQLEAAGGSPGLLRDCTGLTALDLQRCQVSDTGAAAAAIAALPRLQCLSLLEVSDEQGNPITEHLKLPLKLTRLSRLF